MTRAMPSGLARRTLDPVTRIRLRWGMSCLSILLLSWQLGLRAEPSIPILEPSTFRPMAHQPVTMRPTGVAAVEGDRVEHAFVLSTAGRTNLDEFFPDPLTLAAGGVLIGCQYAPLTIPPAQVAGWLRAAGIKVAYDGPITVVRSAAALIRSGEGGDSMTAVRSGMQTELRPLSDPTLLTGGDLGIRFYGHAQQAAKGALVRATHLPSARTYELVTDQGGVVNLEAIKPGAWRLIASTLDRTPIGSVLSIATLTFEIPARDGHR